MPIPVALTIAGSDPSGGAGIQADLKTFHQFGVYGEAVITLLTVQNTVSVSRIETMPADLVAAQLAAVLTDIPPQAAKTGALGSAAIIEALANAASSFPFPLVVDPVMISKHGAPLMEAEAQTALRERLLPWVFLLTPNLPEAEALWGRPIPDVAAQEEAAMGLTGMGPRAVLIKGGHAQGPAVDVLYYKGRLQRFESPRLATRSTHGTGCTFSAAITALLARGASLPDAVDAAKRYITEAIRTNPGLGAGAGPVNHFAVI